MNTYLQSKEIKSTDWTKETNKYYKATLTLEGENARMLNVYKYLSSTGKYVSTSINYSYSGGDPLYLNLYSEFVFAGKVQYATNIADILKKYDISINDWVYNVESGKYIVTLPKGTMIGIESGSGDVLTVYDPEAHEYQAFITKDASGPMILASDGGNYVIDIITNHNHELCISSISPFTATIDYLTK